MRYLVENGNGQINDLPMNTIDAHYETFGLVVNASEKEVRILKDEGYHIEPNFEIGFEDITSIRMIESIRPSLCPQPIIFATLGQYVGSEAVTHYYEVSEGQWTSNIISKTRFPWICCYSKEKWLPVTEYLECIDTLHQIAKTLGLKLVILGQVVSKLPYFKYRSLSHAIINGYIQHYNSLYLMNISNNERLAYDKSSQRNYEPYKNHIHYGHFSEPFIRRQIANWQHKKSTHILNKHPFNLLYQDYFYERIPQTQKIYVPLKLIDDKDCSYYKGLGLETVCIGKHYTFLYDEKQKLDAASHLLRNRVLPHYHLPILSPTPIHKENIQSRNNNKVSEMPLKYHGENVYIGIIGTQGVDYREDDLRKPSGETRIAYIWEQENGAEGTYYTSEQINQILLKKEAMVKGALEEGTSNETFILQVAGGKNNPYEGIATASEFIVAKIKSVPHQISEIYSDITRNDNVLMSDVLIGINKMIEIAQQNHKPLVIYIPYHTNISPHDGSNIYEQILGHLGTIEGVSLIVPSGEEGDKRHHTTLLPAPNSQKLVYLKTKGNVRQITGIIYLQAVAEASFLLKSPQPDTLPVRLDEKGRVRCGETTIYSTGLQDDYQNGKRYILFVIEKMNPGNWKLMWEEQAISSGRIELWLNQQDLNPYVTIEPSTPFTTLGSNAMIEGVMSVGGFKINEGVVLGSSGRGYAWDGSIKPGCACESRGLVKIQNQWQLVEGTAIAASILLGAVATLYDKWQVELGRPYGNSRIMQNLILSGLTQFPEETYPNKGQGDGVLERIGLSQLLEVPMGEEEAYD